MHQVLDSGFGIDVGVVVVVDVVVVVAAAGPVVLASFQCRLYSLVS